MNKTTNYQLNQWERTDKVQMEDFNADNAKIDAAIRAVADSKADKASFGALQTVVDGKAEIVLGTYTGNGAESRFIDLGFTPKAVLLMDAEGRSGSPSSGVRYGGLAFPGPGHNVQYALTIVEGGFQVFYANQYYHSNVDKLEYRYLAIK